EKANAAGDKRYTIIKIPARGTRVKFSDPRTGKTIERVDYVCRTDVGGRPCGHTLAEHPQIDGHTYELSPCAVPGCPCRRAEIFAHPYRLTEKVLEKKMQAELSRTGRIVLWYLQMQNEHMSTELVAFDPAWIRRCSQKDVPEDAWPVLTIDPAWK